MNDVGGQDVRYAVTRSTMCMVTHDARWASHLERANASHAKRTIQLFDGLVVEEWLVEYS
jgi:hypothetical protein